ncbi:sphinganine kinase lcb4 [Monosporozyma unispora]|nr:sphinganine kinase lcb4 [Kazachstania unispora]
MPFTYSKHNQIRACLTTEGIRIKSQFQSRNDNDDPDDNDATGCLTCLSNNNKKSSSLAEDQFIIPNGTMIPFGRIISAKYLNKDKTIKSNGVKPIQKNQIHEHTSLLNHKKQNNISSSNDDSLYDDEDEDLDIEDEESSGCEELYIELTFVHPQGKDVVPTSLHLLMDPLPTEANLTSTTDLVSYIIDKSYENVRKDKSILIIINPFGGAGKAMNLFNEKIKPILDSSPFIHYELARTEYYQHAIDIARDMDITKFDTVACCSGDGIPNEVINGFYQRDDRTTVFNQVCVTQLPCGSGNAMSVSCHWTMNPSYSTLCLLKSVESRIDLMCCQQPSYVDKCPRLSFLSQTMGVIAESDINTEFIRWMGPIRFDIGVAFNIFQFKKYPCDLYVKYAAKTKKQLNIHYVQNKSKAQLLFTPATSQLSISNMNNNIPNPQEQFPISDNDLKIKYSIKDPIPSDWEKIDSEVTDNLSIFYTGKMPYMAKDVKFFPAALPADGTIDMVLTDNRTPIHKITPILLSLDKGTHVLEPEVIHSKVLAYRLIPKIENTVISVDGENFPLEPLQVEVIPGLLKTLLRNGSYVDTEFDSMG